MQRATVRRFAAAMAVAIGFGPISAQALDHVPFELDTVRQAQADGDRIVIGIWATWCGTCQAQIAVLDELADDPRFADITIYHIDYDRQKNLMRLIGESERSQIIAYHGETELGRLLRVTDPEEIEALLLTLRSD